MAVLNLGVATRTLTSPAFIKSAVLIVGGSLLAQMMTNWMRTNVYDLQMRGGDAVYAAVAALLAIAVLPGRYGRPLGLGSGATAVRVVLNDFGLL
jgi:hypothetical protein